MEKDIPISQAWDILVESPIKLPLAISYVGYLLTTVLTACEMMSATNSRPSASASRQTPSPHNHPSRIETRSRTADIVRNPSSEDGSPSSAEGGSFYRSNNMMASGNNTGRGKRDSRIKAVSYGSVKVSGPGSDSRAGVSSNEDTVESTSSGNSTRRSFYILLFLALLSRLCLLPLEAIFFGLSIKSSNPGVIFFRTFPDLSFFSAFSLLVLFYAQLAGTASASGPHGLSVILQRPGYFRNGNVFLYLCYFVFLSITVLFPTKLSPKSFQSIMWLFLCLLYLLLFVILAYFGPVLLSFLRPSLAKRSGLAFRLITMCILCILIFVSRSITFGLAGFNLKIKCSFIVIPSGFVKISSYSAPILFVRHSVGYILLEVIPSLIILFMMHQRRPTSTYTISNIGDSSLPGSGRYTQIPASDVTDAMGRRVQAMTTKQTNLSV